MSRSRSYFWLTLATTLAGCTAKGPTELEFARAALERNPQLKVVGTDAARNTIEVRIKATGQVLTVTPGELAALPIADLVAAAPALSSVAKMPEPAAAIQPMAQPEPAPEPESPPPTAQIIDTPKTASEALSGYKVERNDGRVRVSGPGVSIESSPEPKTTDGTAALARTDAPIICEGARLLHLDRRRLSVVGDAIVARGGCDLYITNSEIAATGAGLVVLDATVHVANSRIQGDTASIDASAKANIYMRSSQFEGVRRRDDQARLFDQGGNTWR
jgi:hypothetical protein